jgi:hypothetical protein
MALGMNVTLRNAWLDAITTAAGASALLRIYNGSRPATGGTATTLLAQLTCNSTFAPGASSGVLTLNSNGSTHVFDGSVSTVAAGTGDLQLDSTSIVTGGTVAISSATITAGNP